MALLRHASTVALLTLASRVLGFARDAGVAALFGTGVVADASVAGLALPQIARRLLGEGALNAALLPDLARAPDAAARRARAGATLVVFALAGLALAALLFLFMPAVVSVLAPGFALDGPRAEGAVLAGRLAVVCLPLALLAGVFAAFANEAGRFARPALAPAAANVAVIALLVLLWLAGAHTMSPSAALAWLAAGAVAGALTQFALNLAAVPRGYFRLALAAADLKAALPLLAGAATPLLAAALPQLRFLIAAAAASGIGGGVAALFYATRLVELPLGLVGASAGAVLLPALAASGREEATLGADSLGAGGITAALALSLPAALGLAVLAHPIVVVLFERGAFDSSASALTASALALLALTLPVQALEKVLITIAFARGLSRLVTLASLAALPVGAVIGFLAVGALGMAGPALGVLASSLVALAGLATGLGRRRLIVLPPTARRRLLRLVVAALAMAAAVVAARQGLEGVLAQGGLAAAVALAGLVALGGAAYAGLALALGGVDGATLRAGLRK
ncbi:lipid II flippase MurJ [Ancylobacter rudongensis]|uniref:Putative peptidoglycan lipid II flippase n=1 Tax=Ancylobacter rudongensis TaxID=177413 RepID=A0A1G4SSV2_9HYPH|nr:lipid II flippase MurJ [Ancylobacter rudongensis]SCW72294.1 putative peptidoglycan lipid II flippase [Ancylobacter rudongensis]